MKNILLLALLCLPLTAVADTQYLKSQKGKVLSGPGFGNSVVFVLKKGDPVEVLEAGKKWSKIRAGKQEGWISNLLLGPTPPIGRVKAIEKPESRKQKESVRTRASAASTAAAARGLREDERARLSDDAQEDYGALEKMENQQVDENAVDRFSAEMENRK